MTTFRVILGIVCLAYLVYDLARQQGQIRAQRMADGMRELREKAEAMEPRERRETFDYRSAALPAEEIVAPSWFERARRRWRAKQQLEMERRLSR